LDKIYKIYLDTSVINFLFADDAPEKKEITIDFFENFIKKNKYLTYISGLVIEEIQQTKNLDKRKSLLEIIEKYPIDFISTDKTDEIEYLANKYIEEKVIPEKKFMDAYHIAVCVVNGIDYLVSWNYKHLANIQKERQVKIINLSNNYFREFRLITPLELLNYE
jgi:predicted nucleic acid-binding protein